MTTELLERAINYTVGTLHVVTPAVLSRPTPCRDWDLRALLAHMNDSIGALREAGDIGQVGLEPIQNDLVLDPVAAVRDGAVRLLGAWTNVERLTLISVGGCPVLTDVVTGTGAIEIAVHGWDIAQACGRRRPLPPALAEDLLAFATTVVTDADRPVRFAAVVPLPPLASPCDRLVAFLGRDPDG